ncbi:OB-fold protein [Enterobacter ludwigii]
MKLKLCFMFISLLYISMPSIAADSITATEIIQDYKDNEMMANTKYKDKEIILKGKIFSIGEKHNLPVVQVSSRDGWNWLIMYFLESERDKLMKLKKGDIIRAKCTGNGYTIVPFMKECALL